MKLNGTKMNVGDMVQLLSHQDSSHASGALLRLNDLRREGILCDLTIKVEGREYKAHKAVMAACSDYFLNAICGGKTTATVTPGDHGCVTVDLDHVTLRGFSPLLEYAYTSNLQVNASDVIDVLSAASYMQMFKVANACSEFMRSNILWAQSRLGNMPGPHPALLNGASRGPDRSASPARSGHRGPALPPDVSSLLKATAVSRSALGQPPLLIPMHSLAYDVGLQQLAASMAGTQGLLPSSVEHVRNTPSAATSPCTRKLTQSPSLWTSVASSARDIPLTKRSPSPKDSAPANNDLGYPQRSSHGHSKGSGGRKSLAVKLESRTDDEDSHSSLNDMDAEGGRVKSLSPTGSEPMEDSWQAIQKMYSMRMQNTESKSQHERHHPPYLPRSVDPEVKPDPRSLPGLDRETGSKNSPGHDSDGARMQNDQINDTERNEHNSNNNNNNSSNQYSDYINDLAMKAGYQGLDKSPSGLFTGGTEVTSSTGAATAAMINGAMRNAFLQQQHLRAAQDNDSNKPITLPAVPPNGQYMSVRRRTLQSTVPKPHQCQICGSRFTRFHNLKQHIKLHSGIKPYECDECGKRFTRNYTLRLHKMKHVGIRNFRCGTCDAAFTSLGEFRAHLRLTMHSHVSGAPPHGHQSPQGSSSEPEDLSSPMLLANALGHASARKYPRYDPALLRSFQKGILGDQASFLSAALGGALMIGDGAGSAGSSCEGSPRMSDRSISPQDLSTRGNKEEGCKDEVSGAAVDEMDDCIPQDRGTKGEYTDQDGINENMEQEVPPTASDVPQRSPSQERADSTSSERDVGDQYDRFPGSDANIDRDSEHDENHTHETENADSSGKSNASDRPLSLVVNASA